MKNNRCSKLTALLLATMMVFSMGMFSALAEDENGKTSEVWEGVGLLVEERTLDTFVGSSDILDGKGNKVTDLSLADPNQSFTLKLSVSEEKRAEGVEGLPEDTNAVRLTYTLENMTAQSGENDDVSWTYEAGSKQLVFKWKNSKKSSFVADIPVMPDYPTENDLSGSYVLGTAGNSNYRVVLSSNAFMDGSRARLKGYAFSEVEGKVFLLSEDSASVWVLNHITGNYYTVRSADNGKYLKINPSTNGLLLEEATEFTAQKLLVEKTSKNGYYFFSYKNKAINNSSFSAVKGFASWDATDRGDNAILKLYHPSDVITEPVRDLSGTWVITNTKRNNAVTAEKLSSGKRLKAVSATVEGNYLITLDDMTTFTFENIVRDWYTVKTDGGYLNITKDGAFISDNPQHLVVRTNNQYSNIILSNSELYDVGYVLNNMNGTTNDGYGVVQKHTYNDNTRLTLIRAENILKEKPRATLTFDMNGGTVRTVPEGVAGDPGQIVVLPELNGTKNGDVFIGWCEVDSVYKQVSGTKHTYHDIYKPGTSYVLKDGKETLYAIYNYKGTKNVRFGIRKDGVIQDEPNGYDVKGYIGHFEVDQSILKETHWVIDINATKPVNEYYVENDVTANLNWVPSAEQIAKALKEEGNVDFDPETQYVHYYVMKCVSDTTWKIDGVIRNKAKVGVTYNTNVAGTEKTSIANMPGGYQVVPGTDIIIGTDENSTSIKRPSRKGYLFMGWNTKADGSGEYYNESATVHLTKNLNLYAQWAAEEEDPLDIQIVSDWPKGKMGYVGAKINLTAKLIGFEGKTYTLCWQYNTDGENWVDVPNSNTITYTYILDETTTQYTWRVVARDIQ